VGEVFRSQTWGEKVYAEPPQTRTLPSWAESRVCSATGMIAISDLAGVLRI
jgi:hypothetical protein